MKRLKWDSLLVSWWREYRTIVIIAITALVVLVPIMALSRSMPTTFEVEGLTNEEPVLDKNDAARPDPDLKCSGQAGGSAPTTCTPADIIRIGYDISLDPRLSTLELTNIQDVYNSRGSAAAAVITPFMTDAAMLRAATMYNTDSNEGAIQKLLDDMKKNKSSCYTNDFMATAKGFLVGSKEQKTLTVAQSEAVRCYAHRFNGIRKCLDACDNS